MAIHRFLVGFAVFAVMLLIVESPARANLLTNGSFEDGSAIPQPDGFLELPVGSTVITGWTVTRDEIDYIGTNFWEHADGNRSLDLDGTPGFGGISQSFATQLGVDYLVTFDLASSPGGDPTVKEMRVQAAGQSQDFSFDSTGRTRPDMGWESRSWTFTANSTLTSLEFFSLNQTGGSHGPALDNVSVTVVPEPISGVLWGFVGMTVLVRRR